MTPDQVTGLFSAGESFIEGTIAAALVALWLLVVALYLARPYMAANLGKFSLRLGADLWWIVYVALRDILLVQVFLGSFIFFYPATHDVRVEEDEAAEEHLHEEDVPERDVYDPPQVSPEAQ